MFTDIPYFHLLKHWKNKTLNRIKIGKEFYFSEMEIPSRALEKHPYVCFSPPGFDSYSFLVHENHFYLKHGYTYNEDEDEDNIILNKKLIPIETLLNRFVFVKLKPTDSHSKGVFLVEDQYQASDVFDYWINHNQFSNPEQWKALGLGNTIFNLLPPNHNYYDRNIICTCGDPGCNNMEVWYIKYIDNYSIPFIIDLNNRIVFDLHYFDKESDWQEEDYKEDNYAKKERYATFPFCFEASNFELFQKTIFPNKKLRGK